MQHPDREGLCAAQGKTWQRIKVFLSKHIIKFKNCSPLLNFLYLIFRWDFLFFCQAKWFFLIPITKLSEAHFLWCRTKMSMLFTSSAPSNELTRGLCVSKLPMGCRRWQGPFQWLKKNKIKARDLSSEWRNKTSKNSFPERSNKCEERDNLFFNFNKNSSRSTFWAFIQKYFFYQKTH